MTTHAQTALRAAANYAAPRADMKTKEVLEIADKWKRWLDDHAEADSKE